MSGHVRRRSCLSVPSAEPRKVARAALSAADEVVFDLEDAVPIGRKADAREAVCRVLAEWHGAKVAVRVNAPRTPWCHLDIEAVAAVAEMPLSIVVPKAEHPGDVEFVDRLLAGVEADRRSPIGVQALIETAPGLARAEKIAAASDRVESLILGYADLAASLGRVVGTDPRRWLYAQDSVLTAARAHGVLAVDGPHLGVANDAAFRAAAQHAADLGFDGKWAIHPAQVDALNDLFMPSEKDLAHAREVLAALEHADAGAVSLGGQMIDQAAAVAARRTLARADGGDAR